MEGHVDYSLCILCSHSFPNSGETPPSPETVQTVNSFLRQIGMIDQKCGSFGPGGLLGLEQVSICPQCLVGIGKAKEKREEVNQAEEQVRFLQGLVLKGMRRLSGQVDENLEEMTKLKGKIKGGDPGFLRVAAKMGGGPSKEGAWTWNNVFQFRDRILKATKEMSQFKTSLVQRNVGGDGHGNGQVRPVVPRDGETLEDTLVRPSSSTNLQRNDGPQAEPEVESGRDNEGPDRDGIKETLEEEAEVNDEQLKVDFVRPTSSRNPFKMAGASKFSPLASSTPKVMIKGRNAKPEPSNVHLLDIEKVPGSSKMLKVPPAKKNRKLGNCQDKTKKRYFFSCARCGKGFVKLSLLRRHRHLEMAHSEKCEWKCEVCGRGFKRKSHLASHAVVHRQEKKTEGK